MPCREEQGILVARTGEDGRDPPFGPVSSTWHTGEAEEMTNVLSLGSVSCPPAWSPWEGGGAGNGAPRSCKWAVARPKCGPHSVAALLRTQNFVPMEDRDTEGGEEEEGRSQRLLWSSSSCKAGCEAGTGGGPGGSGFPVWRVGGWDAVHPDREGRRRSRVGGEGQEFTSRTAGIGGASGKPRRRHPVGGGVLPRAQRARAALTILIRSHPPGMGVQTRGAVKFPQGMGDK